MSDVDDQLARLGRRGERKEAVRLVREETGASLKDAVRIVDAIHDGPPRV